MDELVLRTIFVDTARSYYGAEKGSAKHQEILDIYNSQDKLPRGYRMTGKDPWCATFVSAIAIKCGLTEIIPAECSCTRMIELHKALGTWQELDNYTPQPGDLLLYDWEDSGKGDNTGEADHIGIGNTDADDRDFLLFPLLKKAVDSIVIHSVTFLSGERISCFL